MARECGPPSSLRAIETTLSQFKGRRLRGRPDEPGDDSAEAIFSRPRDALGRGEPTGPAPAPGGQPALASRRPVPAPAGRDAAPPRRPPPARARAPRPT